MNGPTEGLMDDGETLDQDGSLDMSTKAFMRCLETHPRIREEMLASVVQLLEDEVIRPRPYKFMAVYILLEELVPDSLVWSCFFTADLSVLRSKAGGWVGKISLLC